MYDERGFEVRQSERGKRRVKRIRGVWEWEYKIRKVRRVW